MHAKVTFRYLSILFSLWPSCLSVIGCQKLLCARICRTLSRFPCAAVNFSSFVLKGTLFFFLKGPPLLCHGCIRICHSSKVRMRPRMIDHDTLQTNECIECYTTTDSKQRCKITKIKLSKVGCFTCSARGKRCGEIRNSNTGGCQRCLKSGMACLGFPEVHCATLAAHSKKLQKMRKQDNQLKKQTVTTSSDANHFRHPSTRFGVQF